ncbi:syntaxin binding protein 1 [Coemansia sp. RSA 990]|nr:syntaxin binding protein 1 [Coemansia sp. RSA 990]
MKAVLSELPEFKQLQKSYSLHIDLASKCLEVINRNSLAIELVTGRTASGEYVDRTYLETRLIAFLDNNELDESDRIRLLFLYLVLVDGGNATDRRRLEEVPQCLSVNDKRAAVNLCRLGVPTDREEKEESAQEGPSIAGRYQWDAVSEPKDGQLRPRLEPAIKCIVNEQVGNTLDIDLFPWAEEAPPESIPKHILNHNGKKRGVIIVYIAGGVTLSEMRAIYELSETLKRDIYIGSTHIITPRGFLDDLKSLHLEMLT